MYAEPSSKHAQGYEAFFGLREPPFSLAPNPRFLFESASCKEALNQIAYALERREPLVVVSGEIGTGKTLLCRTIVDRLEPNTFLSLVHDPTLEPDELLKRMLQDFGVISKDRTRVVPTSHHDLMHGVQEFLLSLVPLHARAVVVIDEAQHLRPEVLEQIRLISGVHDAHGTLLQMFLVGQDLDPLLARTELRQLKQRVSRYVRLEPLESSEVAEYVEHRLRLGGRIHRQSHAPGAADLERELNAWDGLTPRVTFTPEALAHISQLSGGIPRVVNLLCDRALEAAYAQQLRSVDGPLIAAAAETLRLAAPRLRFIEVAEPMEGSQHTPPVRMKPRRRLVLAAMCAAVVTAAAWAGVTAISGRAPQRGATVRPAAKAPAIDPSAPARSTAETEPITEATDPKADEEARSPRTSPSALATPSLEPTEAFEIVVASFHTEARARAVAADISALGLGVRQRTADGWQQLLAGPFPSRGSAEGAQSRLAQVGFADTQIVAASH